MAITYFYFVQINFIIYNMQVLVNYEKSTSVKQCNEENIEVSDGQQDNGP